MKKNILLVSLFLFLGKIYAQNCHKKLITVINNVKVWQLVNSSQCYFFKSKMAIDADGSPRAYHPKNIGLDDLRHAGSKGHWWGIATNKNGKPFVQTAKDPYPGYYVSTTSLCDARYPEHDPRKYVNSEKIPYIALPPELVKLSNTKLGDVGYVYNTKTQKGSFVIFADTGPKGKIGEGSIYLAKKLGINDSPRIGGQTSGVIYFVFLNSKVNGIYSKENIEKKAKGYFQKLNINWVLKNCF